MPTYCIPDVSSVPGWSEFKWWDGTPDPDKMKYSPDNPNWLGAFSLSEGAGANRDMQFRALHGSLLYAPDPYPPYYLFLSWVVRAATLDTTLDRVNFLLSDGTNYVAVQVKLGTTSPGKVAGTQDTSAFSYKIRNCAVSGTNISVTGTATQDGADIESTGRMWVNVTSPERQLHADWAFQVAIPLGMAWQPSAVNIPISGPFKLWYEVWTSMPGRTAPYQVPTTPAAIHTTAVSEIIPTGLQVAHLLDLATGGPCTDAVTLSYSQVGVRNVAAGDPPRPDQFTIRLDLGQPYPPNQADNGGPPYNTSYIPNVAQSQFQNQFYAQPDLTGLTAAQQAAVHARFSLANWGSQVAISTSSSWRPIPGGQDVPYQTANGEARFVWPLPDPNTNAADAFTTTLVRNINKFLNATAVGSTRSIPPDAQHPHQCVLVELSSSDPSVVFTRSSCYVNMNVTRASVMRDKARISIDGLEPISALPRDVYLYVQKFNLPQVAPPTNPDMRIRSSFEGLPSAASKDQRSWEIEDLAAYHPTYIIHAYYDTGEKMKREDGSLVPIIRPLTAFGYFILHAGELYGWETRLNGATKIAENFYRLAVPNHGAQYVETAVQARESASVPPLPPETGPVSPDLPGCLALILRLFGIGKK